MPRLFALLTACLALGCGERPAASSADATCDGESRPQLDCTTEFSYDGHAVEGGFSAMGIVDLDGRAEQTALRALDVETERYVAAARRLCDEYNKCVLDGDTYATRSENLRRRMSKVPALYEALDVAAPGAARREALAAAYDAIVGAAPLSMSFSVMASRPSETSLRPIQEGETLPTGSKVAFRVSVSEKSHVYLFQRTEQAAFRSLFPHPALAHANPVATQAPLEVPGGSRTFVVDENDVGTERVFLVASREPLPSLDHAAAEINAGRAAPPTLEALGRLTTGECAARALVLDGPPASAAGCARPRGLRLAPGESGSAPVSVALRTEAADDLVASVFSFRHVP